MSNTISCKDSLRPGVSPTISEVPNKAEAEKKMEERLVGRWLMDPERAKQIFGRVASDPRDGNRSSYPEGIEFYPDRTYALTYANTQGQPYLGRLCRWSVVKHDSWNALVLGHGLERGSGFSKKVLEIEGDKITLNGTQLFPDRASIEPFAFDSFQT